MSELLEKALRLEAIGTAMNDSCANVTTTGQLLIDSARLLRVAATVDVEHQIELELRRWQDGIADHLAKLTDCDNIDGSGCDSGDPLDFTLDEISQAIGFLKDKHEAPPTTNLAAETDQ